MKEGYMTDMKKRYPGPLPFLYDDRNLFFGRDQEIEYLTTLIINNQITILHGKSGYGKSSLINAGLIPSLLENFNCEIIRVRFYNYDKKNPLTPLHTFLNTIKQHVSGRPYLDSLITAAHPSAWRYFKKLQYDVLKKFPQDEQADVNVASQLSYILVIDQFEELFTYPKEAVIELAKEFHEILLHRIPEEYQECLKDSFRKRESLEEHKDELSILDKDIPLKVIFSLRTERFNYLTHLVNYIPTLLNNTYKIKRMTANQVRAAIVEPALVADDGFSSPPFAYEDRIVESLIDFLNADTKGGNGGKIEVFEMQIICQKLEEILISHLPHDALNPSPELPVLYKEEMILKSAAIKDKNDPFAEIIKNYYKETIEAIPQPVEQLSARYLIELKLIDQATNNRISLDNAFVKQTGISEAVLRHLIDKRIIRIEMNTVSGHSLEISHDSLVMPVLNAALELGELKKNLAHFYEGAIDAETKNSRNIRDIINTVLLEEKDVKKTVAAELDDDDFALLRSNPVITEKNPQEGVNDIQAFGVKKIFQQTAQQSRAKAQQSNTKGWAKKFAIISVIFIAVATTFFYVQDQTRQRTNRLSALLFLSIVDTIPNKVNALRLTEYIYNKAEEGKLEVDASAVEKKIRDLLKMQEVQAVFSHPDLFISSASLKREEIDLSPTGEFIVYNNKTNDANEPWGSYIIVDQTGKKLAQFNKILYAYFIDGTDVAVLARSSDKTDSLLNANKFTNDFILFNCKTSDSQTITLNGGHYLYPPQYSAPSWLHNPDAYWVQVSGSGNLVIPVYDAADSSNVVQQVETISRSDLNPNLFPGDFAGTAGDNERLITPEKSTNVTPQWIAKSNGELLGVNLKKKHFIFRNKPRENDTDIIWRSDFQGKKTGLDFPYAKGIQSAVYNETADAILVYTKDDRLYLLDSAMRTKAGFQLTANDLYGFSEKGNRFFYVRNEALSFFNNDDQLINLFDLAKVRKWLHPPDKNNKLHIDSLKKVYELLF